MIQFKIGLKGLFFLTNIFLIEPFEHKKPITISQYTNQTEKTIESRLRILTWQTEKQSEMAENSNPFTIRSNNVGYC